MTTKEWKAGTVEAFDNDIVGFCRRLSKLAKGVITSFEAVIYPKEGRDIDYLNLVFFCSPSDRCSIKVFAVKVNGSRIRANAAEMPSLIESVLAESALSGSYAEIIKGNKRELARWITDLSSKLSDGTWEIGYEKAGTEKFMTKIIGSVKAIGTSACPSASGSALSLFLRSLMAAVCLAHSDRISSALADEIKGGYAGHTIPSMILASRVSTGDNVVTLFLELTNDEAGVAAEVREGGTVSVLEGFEAVRSFIGLLKMGGVILTSYCTILHGHTGIGQY